MQFFLPEVGGTHVMRVLMEQITLHLPAGPRGAQPEEGAFRESNISDEPAWLEEDEEDSPFHGIVSAAITFTLVFIIPHWLGW